MLAYCHDRKKRQVPSHIDRQFQHRRFREDSANYAIVGGGSAGCAFAARLSENSGSEVILIESGGVDDAPEFLAPTGQGKLRKSQYDWDYSSLSEPGLDGRLVYLPRGKALGGSSSINVMIHIRGHRADFDGWARDGAKGWSYDEVLPYFRKSKSPADGRLHGASGPLSVSEPRHRIPYPTPCPSSSSGGLSGKRGFQRREPRRSGVLSAHSTQWARCSASTAYLRHALVKRNLKVVTDAHATRILFDGSRACGVEILRGGQLEKVFVDDDVILTAGAYNSPQLLLLSGIGPAADLRALGIDVRQDLPLASVFKIILTRFWHGGFGHAAGGCKRRKLAMSENDGRGPLASNGAEAGAFVRTRLTLKRQTSNLLFAQLWPTTGPSAATWPRCFGNAFSYNTHKSRQGLAAGAPIPKPNRASFTIITRRRRSPKQTEGVRMALKIAAQPALRQHIVEPHTIPNSESE